MATKPRPFTPTRENPADLQRRTVGRQELLARIHQRITNAVDTDNLAHSLIIGPRGSGKTHLLTVARHAVETAPAIADRLAITAIPEDGIGITSYPRLLHHIIKSLDPVPTRLELDIGHAETRIAELLDGRRLLLIIENLDRIFRKLGEPGQRDLRGWIENTHSVLLLASTPLLFEGVQSRVKPLFGSFNIEHLNELNLEEGTQLLAHLRPEDPDLLAYVESQSGQARLQALSHLTGGSPRLWTILADILTVENLDELVPALEQLLEELVTYYQQRLWDLGPNEEAIIESLGTGQPSQTATELAAATGLDQRLAGTTLGRLAAAGWVRGRKVPGTDQRSTWYELREPLLRHHFNYRTNNTEPLTLVVQILKIWYDPTTRLAQLRDAAPKSEQERYLAETLAHEPRSHDHGYVSGSASDLLAQARIWIAHPESNRTSIQLGLIAEAIALRALDREPAIRSIDPRTQATIQGALSEDDRTKPAILRVAAMLDAAGQAEASLSSDDRASQLEWLSASWNRHTDPQRCADRMSNLAASLDADSPLGFVVHLDAIHSRGQAGRQSDREALADTVEVLGLIENWYGADHVDTANARAQVAFYTGESGDVAGALVLYEGVAADSLRVLGADHPDTLTARAQVAFYTGRSGDVAGALVLTAEIAEHSLPLAEDLLDAVEQQQPRSEDDLVRQLRLASEGEAEALARLPIELRELAEGFPD
ncbi:MAG: hypothetical protein ACI91O_000728 [Candidatus Poriferisodalaceae bacterium]|jgi:hypothetical protein